jgi:hypothetical protein
MKSRVYRMSYIVSGLAILFASAAFAQEKDVRKSLIVALKGEGEATEAFTEHAENVLYEQMRGAGYRQLDPAALEEVKKDKVLWAQILDANATALMKIRKKYRADVLVQGVLTLSSARTAGLFEANASLSVRMVDMGTAEITASATSSPMGTVGRPMPTGSTQNAAQQTAILRAAEEITAKLAAARAPAETVSDAMAGYVPREATTLRLGALSKWNLGSAVTAVASPGGRGTAFAATSLGKIYRLREGEAPAEWGSHASVAALAVSRAGALVSAGGTSVKIWSLDEPGMKAEHKIPFAAKSLAISPDGGQIAVGGAKGEAAVLQSDGMLRAHLRKGHPPKSSVNAVAFSHADRYLLTTADKEKAIVFWDIGRASEYRRFQESKEVIFDMALSPGGNVIALALHHWYFSRGAIAFEDARYIRLRSAATGEEIALIKAHRENISAIDFGPFERYIVSGSEDHTVRIWDTQTLSEVTLQQTPAPVLDTAFSLTGDAVVAGLKNGEAWVWKIQ